MGNDKKIYQKASKRLPVVVHDYNQVLLLGNLSEALRTPKEVFSQEEAAAYLCIKLQTLKNYSKKKKITWRQVGKQKIYSKTDLDEFLERRSKLHKDF